MAVLNPLAFHDVLSGQRRDLGAIALRLLLQCCEPAYALAIGARNLAFDAHLRARHQVAVPVISIGNITTGGTGKTPFVAWAARWLLEQSLRVAIVSRGYRAHGAGRNDEALELELQLPDVPHVQNPNRVQAAQRAIDQLHSEVILLDDGFQHRRLHRHLDIVLIDALQPFGYEHLLPRGLLREPLRALRRADVIGLSRANLVSEDVRQQIWSRITRVAPQALTIHVEYRPQCLRAATGELESLDHYRGRPVLAFCGIGNPQGFAETLASCGYHVAALRAFADHHAYTPADLESIANWADKYPPTQALLCTEKDLVKIGAAHIGPRPLWSLRVAAKVTHGFEPFQQRLRSVCHLGAT